ncbi:MAG: type II secretion system protein [Sumerlaeia bacterium]
MGRRRTANQRAMTMIEIMLVVVILGILMAVALPKMSGTNERAALNTTARDIAKLAAIARQTAQSTQKQTALILDLEQRQWYLDLDYDPEKRRSYSRSRDPIAADEEPQDLHQILEMSVLDEDNDPIDEDEIAIVFYPNGTSTGGRIFLKTTRRERKMTVEIEEATGRSEAYEGEPKSLAQRFADAGVDVSALPGLPGADEVEGANAVETEDPRGGFRRVAGSSEERIGAYSSAVERILGKTQQKVEREKEIQERRGNAP